MNLHLLEQWIAANITPIYKCHISPSLNKIVLYPWSGYNVILWQITVHGVMDTTGIADAKIPMWHISICSLNTLTFSDLPIAKKYIVVKHFCQSNVQSITLSILHPRVYDIKTVYFWFVVYVNGGWLPILPTWPNPNLIIIFNQQWL